MLVADGLEPRVEGLLLLARQVAGGLADAVGLVGPVDVGSATGSLVRSDRAGDPALHVLTGAGVGAGVGPALRGAMFMCLVPR